MPIDSKDKKIIEALRSDARASVKGLSKKTGIRPSTVHQRIQRLVKNKTIEKFTIRADSHALEESFIVFMLVKGSTSDYIGNEIIQNAHVREIFGITGEYDLLLKLKFKDVEEFNSFILKFRKNRKNIQSTLTMVATANLKEEL